MDELGSYSPVFSGILDYVRGKTGGARMARRSDINPAEIAPFLKQLVIFDVVEGDDATSQSRDYIFRLMGTEVSANFGEWTGRSVRNLPNKQAAERAIEAGNAVIESGEPLGFLARELSDEKSYLQAFGLYIPLANDNGKAVQVLVVSIVMAASN